MKLFSTKINERPDDGERILCFYDGMHKCRVGTFYDPDIVLDDADGKDFEYYDFWTSFENRQLVLTDSAKK